ncbi:peptide-methionine (S)-S-oxide reductase MsrA [Lysobacter sp. D1-1-M9]|uniref:peptide-methionine (S)-S-oxide reductase MsrA n=1 Tax=Novilysobacter longmucuonensis TaxID=3098603 RepID=UPI002FCB9F43
MTMPPQRLRRLAATLGGLLMLGVTTACAQQPANPPATNAPDAGTSGQSAVAIFAGGCFWCMEPPFDELPGVTATTSGYIGGHVADPSYQQVSAGGTGHTEAVRVNYNPAQVSYATLLDVFWRNIDPVAVDRQFCDVGDQYRSAIFTTDAQQKRLAEASKRELQTSGRFERPIATEIAAAPTFYPAEQYHQDYYEKNPVRYKFYSFTCGRQQRLDEVWGAAGE